MHIDDTYRNQEYEAALEYGLVYLWGFVTDRDLGQYVPDDITEIIDLAKTQMSPESIRAIQDRVRDW